MDMKKDVIIIPVEESEESGEEVDVDDDFEECSELASEEGNSKDPSELTEQTSSTKGGKRHSRRMVSSATYGSEQRSRSRKRRRKKKKKVKSASSQKVKATSSSSNHENIGENRTGSGSAIESKSDAGVTDEEIGRKSKVKRIHSAPTAVYKRINRREMISSSAQIRAQNCNTKGTLESGMSGMEESTVMKLRSSATTKTDNDKSSSKIENGGYKVEKNKATTFKLSNRPWTAGATETVGHTSSRFNSTNGLTGDKQRSMLLALSKESYQRTLPPVLHSQSMNFSLDSSKYSNGTFQSKPTNSRANGGEHVNTAVMKYANSKGVVLHKEMISNARFIPIVPDVDNTKIVRSNSFLRDINFKEKQAERELSKSCHSVSPLTTLDRDLKPILKDSQNAKTFEKRKSVRFQFSEGY